MRILESQRHKILDQLEKCPSSGDEMESPKKRAKYSQDVNDDAQNNHNNDSSTTNCNGKVLDHRDSSSASYSQNNHRYHHSEIEHRKTVEIRRLSDCNIKHSASVPGGAMTSSINYTKPNRRPSTDSQPRYQTLESYQTMMHKRRKTSATASTSSSSSTTTLHEEIPASKIRGSQVHLNQSFEASGGESEHGSRPGTPLFDERPENTIDPRTPRITSRSRELLNLPLPKFAQQFHQQLRQSNQLLPANHAMLLSEKHDYNNMIYQQHSSLKNRSISPTPLAPQIRSRSNSLMPPISNGSTNSDGVLTSPHPASLVSNSSDSEPELGTITGPNTSPSLEERLKKFTEDYDSWSSNGRSSSSSHYLNNYRAAVPEIAVPETPELLRSVIKNSMFDEDSKRLENIGDKYVTQPTATMPTATVTSKNAFGTFSGNGLSLSGTSSPLVTMMSSVGVNSTLALAQSHQEAQSTASALSNSLGKLHMPTQQPVTITTMIHQRLGSSGTGSPLNSPNTASPYNSPNPSSASSIGSIKVLQYPFPTHPTLNASSVTPTTATSSFTSLPQNVVSCTTTVSSAVIITTSNTSSSCQKPKTLNTLGKSASLQEVTPATVVITATGHNNNSNNINASCNKSSTNNNNVNNSCSENQPSKLLMKSASMPNCETTGSAPRIETSSLEKVAEKIALTQESDSKIQKIDESKSQPESAPKKEGENSDKKNLKDKRRNGDNEDFLLSLTEDVKDHMKKEKELFLRKEKEVKKNRDLENENKIEEKKSKSTHKKSNKDDHHHSVEEKKEDSVSTKRTTSPSYHHKRRVSFEDVSSVDSASEHTGHVENNKSHDKCSKDAKHHESSRANSRHHHHHSNHKDKKHSGKESKEKLHGDDDSHSVSKTSDCGNVKDSIFDELKRNSKENIIKTSEKSHKNKKHHHHHHRENSTKDKENHTQVNNFNDTSSSVMTEDVGRSSDDEVIRNHHLQNHKNEDHEKRLSHDHQKNRLESSAEESSDKKKYQRRSLNNSLSTDDTDDSDENKKISFFDIPDEAPNISMYDKVKARSCKNLKKQEEEKKIKDKFSALKQSRAKRERKRLNTSDEDSDSDMNDANSSDMFQMKFRKSQLSGTDEEEKDSDHHEHFPKKNINQFSICDDDSSESGITINDSNHKRPKFTSRKMSRTNVIDSSDDDIPVADIKRESIDSQPMVTSDFDDLKKVEDQHSGELKNHKHGSNGTKKRHHDKGKDDKSSKKTKKPSKDINRKSSASLDHNQKRDEKMDDIFGPISDDEIKQDSKNTFENTAIEIKKEPLDEIKTEPSEVLLKENQREESRKRKEKRRREREKQRAFKEDGNSVDLDEAGRVLEAQLMSDNEQKLNNNELPKDSKSDDVFRFTDGDDEMKRDSHDGSLKKKKKKKRTKEERKHHHNHHHVEIKQEVVDHVESSRSLNNNNNTKNRIDVINDDIKPSVPFLNADLTTETSSKVMPEIVEQFPLVKKEPKAKLEVAIPGFGALTDETVHQKAVQSITPELEKKQISVELLKVEKVSETVSTETKISKVDNEKLEEKSRVVISQEETEDAVAALLGESFSMVADDVYDDPYDVPIVTNEADSVADAMIPPEEDEEMKKAILSLNPDLDHKPETPQSEHELQIDTDNEEIVEEEELSVQPFDNPPKTPDVDMAQMEKEKKAVTPEPEKLQEKKPDKTSEPLKEIAVVTMKEQIINEKSLEKKEPPSIISRTPVPNYQARFTAPTIIIPSEKASDRISPKSATQVSPIIKSSLVQSPKSILQGKETINVSLSSTTTVTPATVLVPSQRATPLGPSTSIGISPNISHPVKGDNKTGLVPPAGMHVKMQSPLQPIQQINLQSTTSTLPIQVIQKTPQQASPEKKKVEPKLNNMKTLQNVVLAQQARPPQIIYPPTSGNISVNAVKTQLDQNKPTELEKPEQWQLNASSVIQKVDSMKEEKLCIEKKTIDVESSHDEDEFEENSPENSIERESGGKKGRGTGRQQRGRKAPSVQSPSAMEDAGIQTRRGGKPSNVNKRGRGCRNTSNKTITPIQNQIPTTMPSPAPPAGNYMRQQKTSESDVYEFHDDSGEELVKSADGQRPRLIMTIKSSTVTTSVNTQPIMTSPASSPNSTTTVVQALHAASIQQPISLHVVSESLSEPQLLASTPLILQQAPSPAPSDEFAQPNNTRKSRRLQEKDGTRTSVDDTIDDVIRNMAPNHQAQIANSRRATRQTNTPANTNVLNTASPNQAPQVAMTMSTETKKPARVNRKQKDRQISETSESETEKKIDICSPILAPILKSHVIQEPQIIQHQTPTQQHQQPPQPSIIKHPEIISHPKPLPKESSELLQLIDPVTGELQKMTQSKEGQYVPVSDNRSLGQRQLVPQSTPISSFSVEIKTEEKKTYIPPTPQTIPKLQTPILVDQVKQSIVPITESNHVIKPVITQNPTYTKPPKSYVLNPPNILKPQAATTSVATPTTVISSQGMMKINAPIGQHPSTIYNLPNIIPTTIGKFVAPQGQKTLVMPPHTNQPTIIQQNQQMSMHQSQTNHQKIPSNGQQPQIVVHSQHHPLIHPQQGGNLMINIPTSSSAGQSISSPRMQQQNMKQIIQRSTPSQVSSQPTQSSAPPTTVVMKAAHQHHIVATNPEPKTTTQTTYIQQGTKILQALPDAQPLSYISGGREIIYVGGNVQKQTIYPNYPPNKYTHQQQMPSPTQSKPQQTKMVEKISSQPAVSVTHIHMPQMPSHQQQPQQPKVYFTNSGQVITNVPSSVAASNEANERHQQWLAHEKQTQPHPLKNRYVMESYDDAHRTQMQSERAQQHHSQVQGKRNYVIEGPAHGLPSPSQPAHHASIGIVNQPIIPPQNKTVIGLNQAPQILTGAVASPPLKAHLTSPQPIVTGKFLSNDL